MTDALRHRGPDGEGYCVVGQVAEDGDLPGLTRIPGTGASVGFGHRRLAILDLSERGAQPMQYRGRHVISYNGEVYNYPELRGELSREGYEFSTGTDTEVVLAAFDRWREACLSRFHGMWAFVLLDRERRELFVARDRFGVKPLFHCRSGGDLLFASEIKALLRHPAVMPRPNLPLLGDVVDHGAQDFRRETPFEGVFRFPPGHFCRIDLGRGGLPAGLRLERYHDLEPSDSAGTFDQQRADAVAARYAELLKESVRLRLRSDVPVAVNLSGGLDSSSIAVLVREVLDEREEGDRLETFSSVYPAPELRAFDESRFVDELASRTGIRSNRVQPTADDVLAGHRKVIEAMETPLDGTSMSSWHTFRVVAARGFKVTLDGQGADEQLAGYLPYLVTHLFALRGADLEREARHLADVPGAGPLVESARKLQGAARLLSPGLLRLGLRLAGRQTHRLLQPLNQLLRLDVQTKLVNFFSHVDRVAMAHSVESREPFMDFRLVEFLMGVPACYKIHDGWTKHLARRAFAGRLPDSIAWRRDKMGWPSPDEHWFRGPLRPWLEDRVSRSAFVREVLRTRHVPLDLGTASGLARAVRILNLATWHEVFLG